MPNRKDFSEMTLEELTPIVSMRPGKEYTRDELRAARDAFMRALSSEGTSSAEAPSDNTPDNTDEEKNAAASEETAAENISETSETPLTDTQDFTPAKSEDTSPAPTENEEENLLFNLFSGKEDISSQENPPVPSPDSADFPKSEDDTFILQNENRFARFLYVLYAYFLVPILALEALIFLIASVATAIAVPDTSYLFVHILGAVFYTMLVAFSWHQFMHRTLLGLILNRSLIAVCIFRGISMLYTGETVMGVIMTAVFSLFLVFFIGYDSTFTIEP